MFPLVRLQAGPAGSSSSDMVEAADFGRQGGWLVDQLEAERHRK